MTALEIQKFLVTLIPYAVAIDVVLYLLGGAWIIKRIKRNRRNNAS